TPSEQPRDEAGRFVAQAEEPANEGDITREEDIPELFRQEIDLGTGGKQVFEAATQEELIAKLVEAQTHASRKIRELNQAVKQVPVPAPKPRELTADEKYILAQQFQNEPDKA